MFIRNIYECDLINYLDKKYSVCLIDKSILLTCPEIIPTSQGWQIADNNLQITGKHFVIPTSVILELEEQKRQEGLDSFTSKDLLFRIRQLLVETDYQTDQKSNGNLISAIYFRQTDTLFSVFANVSDAELDLLGLAFGSGYLRQKNKYPQIQTEHQEIRTAQLISAANQIAESLKAPVDGWTEDQYDTIQQKPTVEILTCNNLVTILARANGIETRLFEFTKRLYTGRRDIIVPPKFYNTFLDSKDGIDHQTWQEYFPDEPELIANEFISMTPNLELADLGISPARDQYAHIGRFDQKANKIVHLTHYKNFGIRLKNEGQAMYAEAISDPDISVVFVTGSAGTGKTFLSVLGAIKACDLGKFLQATIVPCSIDVQRTLGFLPGNLDDKIGPNIAPIKNAIQNYIKLTNGKISKTLENTPNSCDKQRNLKDSQNTIRTESDKLYNKHFKNIPVEAARGLDFANMFVIYDEFQDQTPDQADMLLKRIAKDSKVIISGDIKQVHQHGLSKQNNGLSYAKQLCSGLPMVAQIELKDIEVVRSEFVQAIVARQS
jgi:Predicted ATPase related to phosphate starvation-inducible protein PhoH